MLIADDEPAPRGALAELLAHEDGVVLIGTAGDADEAIQLADDARPDVALVDVKMPAGGGPRAAREIVRVSPATRVIALSAFEDRPTVLEMLRAGAVGYLVKGTGADEIVGSIERVMSGGASLSAEVMGGIVQELTSQLRREEIATRSRRRRVAARSSDSWPETAYPWCSSRSSTCVPTRSWESRRLRASVRFPCGHRTSGSPRPCELELGVQLEMASVRQALRVLPGLPDERLPLDQLLTSRGGIPAVRRRFCPWTRGASCSRSPSTRPSRTTTR